MSNKSNKFSDQEALNFHSKGRPGKIEINATKPMATQRDLSLAYSPGVAVPVQAIADNPDCVYDYTAKGNLVAVISNGSAILGMGNLGPLASKPVMEGKAVLFKRFADVDGIDLEVDAPDVETFVNCVRPLGPSFGGINLEDIKAPECFIIEQQLREVMDIPVFHDDQHGTAIITAAGFINALDLTKRNIKRTRVVMNGAGAASIACAELIKAMGLPHDKLIMCDSKGVIYEGRVEGMNQWKSAHAAKTKCRTLEDAMKGADVFIGLSVKGAVDKKMVKSMARKPIIFAMANPDPEITPEEIEEVRKDAIIATGRSDYPNQINNVLGFPYIFRGALDVRARAINDEMKIAAAQALADLAREEVHDEVSSAYAGHRHSYGKDYIIPAPFDPRLIEHIPCAVAKAAMDSGVARKNIEDFDEYRVQLSGRLNPTVGTLSRMFIELAKNPKRVVFAEAEQERMIRAALNFKNSGYGTPILVGRENIVLERLKEAGVDNLDGIEIANAKTSSNNQEFTDFLYERLRRKGYLQRDIRRLVNSDRNVFGACLVARGYADAMVTGITRHYWKALRKVLLVIDPKEGSKPFALSAVVTRNKTVFIADTAVNDNPKAAELADIAVESANIVRILGQTPRVAFLSYSNFGNPTRPMTKNIHEAVDILQSKNPDFEFEGEMMADVALNPDMARYYPFTRLTGPANILIMPGLHSANISSKLLAELGGGRVIGPILWGLKKSVQITRMSSTSTDILNMAGLAAMGSLSEEEAFFPGF
ncbi:MAG: NADP-dependent malic enzyme [Alphaproteobacteria bacterium]